MCPTRVGECVGSHKSQSVQAPLQETWTGGMSELKPIYELRLMLWAPPACTRRAGTQLSRSGRENTTDSLAAEVQRVGHFNHHLHVYLYATLVNH